MELGARVYTAFFKSCLNFFPATPKTWSEQLFQSILVSMVTSRHIETQLKNSPCPFRRVFTSIPIIIVNSLDRITTALHTSIREVNALSPPTNAL